MSLAAASSAAASVSDSCPQGAVIPAQDPEAPTCLVCRAPAQKSHFFEHRYAPGGCQRILPVRRLADRLIGAPHWRFAVGSFSMVQLSVLPQGVNRQWA